MKKYLGESAVSKLIMLIKSQFDTKLDSTANAVSASKIAKPVNISLTGDVTGTTTFDGSADVQISTSLKTSVPASIATSKYEFLDTATVDTTEEQDISIPISFADTSVSIAPSDIYIVSYEGLLLRSNQQYVINFEMNTITLLGFKRKIGEVLSIELYKLTIMS